MSSHIKEWSEENFVEIASSYAEENSTEYREFRRSFMDYVINGEYSQNEWLEEDNDDERVKFFESINDTERARYIETCYNNWGAD